MKKERRVYTKATDKLKKLFDNESAVYFSNVGQDDETGVVNSHGLYLEDADEVGEFEFLYLVGRHDAFAGERVSGIEFSDDEYPAIGWGSEMSRYVGVSGVISEWYAYNNSLTISFDDGVDFDYPAELVAKQLDKKSALVEETGSKETVDKLSYELDFGFIKQMAERMQVNKGKYEPYNWKKPIDVESLKQALFRHVLEVMNGNYEDDGRLEGHLEAIACNAMMINYQIKSNKNE